MERTIRIREASRRLNVSRFTVWRLIRQGELRAVRTPGGHHRILVASLEAFERVQKRLRGRAG